MGMFNVQVNSGASAKRSPAALAKLERLRKALRHEEPDRVPISDFFWGGFVERWRKELNLPQDATPYQYYDLDWIATVCNMDPWIRPFEVLRENAEEVVVRTGFGAVMRKKYSFPMPEFISWDIKELDELQSAIDTFTAPSDPRRFYQAGDNQITGVGDGFQRNSPAWLAVVKSLYPDFPVFGSIIECSECLTRLVGPESAMLFIGSEPEAMGEAINRIGQFYLDMAKAEIDAGAGYLDGLVIWGDVAYKTSTFVSPDYWRKYYKPWVGRIVEYAHSKNLPVIYHGCGNVKAIFPDYIEIGVDAYNPLEVKAGMDAVELRGQYGHRIGFCGNSDMQIWERGDREEIRREVLYKLNAAKGGGFIFQSDHSVSSSVSGQTYDYIVKLVREYGNYPLNLGESDHKQDCKEDEE